MTAITRPERTEEFKHLVGDPARAVGEIRQAQESGYILSSQSERLIERYPEQWVALHNGDVIAAEDSFEQLMEAIEPAARAHVLVRYIGRNELKMIL
jgi:hypothetical protein